MPGANRNARLIWRCLARLVGLSSRMADGLSTNDCWPRDYDKTFPLPRGAAVAAARTHQCRYPQTQFARRTDSNPILGILMFGSFSRAFAWFVPQSLLGPGSRHCYGINYTQNRFGRLFFGVL